MTIQEWNNLPISKRVEVVSTILELDGISIDPKSNRFIKYISNYTDKLNELLPTQRRILDITSMVADKVKITIIVTI